MSTPSQTLDTPWSALNRFFFAEEAPFGMALLRISLPWVLMFDAVRRWPWVREIYSADGAPAPLSDNLGYFNFLPELPAPLAVALNTAMIFLLLTASVGWCTRFSLLASCGLYYYFGMMDCMSTLTKYNVVANHVLLLLAVSPCGEVWSVDRWLKTSHLEMSGRWTPPPRYGIWAQRLLQSLLGMLYLGASFTKLHTPAFFSGDQLMYWMMTDIHDEHPLGNYLAQYPLLLVMFAYITIIWEIMFIVGVWGRWTRIPILVIGATFHVMTALTLGLYIFPMVMCLTYLCFVNERDVLAVRKLLRRLNLMKYLRNIRLPERVSAVPWSQARWVAVGTFALAAMLVMLGGVQAEQMMDVYGMRGVNGPLTLKEIPAEEAQRLLTSDLPLEPTDKFLAVDLGLTSIGDHLLSRSTTFQQGDRIIVQVTFNPPHEDMWVECLLCEEIDKAAPVKDDDRDADETMVRMREITRQGNIVGRESLRHSFYFGTDRSMEPGEYTFRIRSGARVVLQKKFTLTANSNSAMPKSTEERQLSPEVRPTSKSVPRRDVEQSEPDE